MKQHKTMFRTYGTYFYIRLSSTNVLPLRGKKVSTIWSL